ncbi:MAG: HEPN domain-containing protein [Taibaiella sp.]|nr:HEPN domain-containing protein [Taibaiella sp.]
MKTSLSHLPVSKQDDICRITDIIVKKIQPEKVILFGSYATGRWVEDRYSEGLITYEYISDYDILVITRQGERRKDYEVQDIVVNTFRPRTPINIIANDIDFVNRDLERNRYFFSDIKKEGIMLYDAGNIPLSEPRELAPQEKKEMAQADFDQWYNVGLGFLKAAKMFYEDENYKLGLFQAHQAAESIYNAVMLVFTGYKPKTHNIEMLYHYNKNHSKELAMVFPQNTPEEKHYFEQLKRGYIEARYSKDFVVTKEELEVLIDRLTRLQSITEKICREKIERFGKV